MKTNRPETLFYGRFPFRHYRPMANCEVCENGELQFRGHGHPRICPRCLAWIDKQRNELGIP